MREDYAWDIKLSESAATPTHSPLLMQEKIAKTMMQVIAEKARYQHNFNYLK